MPLFSCFHVMGSNQYRFWFYLIYQNIWSYNLDFLKNLYQIKFNELIIFLKKIKIYYSK
jgi:hypothetical protein